MRSTRSSAAEDSKKTDTIPFTRKLRSVSKRVTLVQNVKNVDNSLLKEKDKTKKNKIKDHQQQTNSSAPTLINEHSNFSREEETSLVSGAIEPTFKNARQNELKSSESASISGHSDHLLKGEALLVSEENKTKSKGKKLLKQKINEHSNFLREEETSLVNGENEPASKKLKSDERQRRNAFKSSEAASISGHSDHLLKGEALLVSEENKTKSKGKKILKQKINEHSNFSREEETSLVNGENQPASKKLKSVEQQRQNAFKSSEAASIISRISRNLDHLLKGEALLVSEENKTKSKSKKLLKQKVNEHSNFSREEETTLVSGENEPASKKLKSDEQQRQNEFKSSEAASIISRNLNHLLKREALLVNEENKAKSKSKKHLKQKDRILNESSVIFKEQEVQKSTDKEKITNIESNSAEIETTIEVEKSFNKEVRATDSAVKSSESLTESVQKAVDIQTLPKTSIDSSQFYGKIGRSKVITSKKWHPYVKIRNVEMEICRKPMEKLMATKQKIAEPENEPDMQIPIELETPLLSEVSGIEILNHDKNTELDSNLMKIDNDNSGSNSVSKNDCTSSVNATTDSVSSTVNTANSGIGCEVNAANKGARVMNELIDEFADNLLKKDEKTVNEIDSAKAVSEVGCAVLPVSEFWTTVNDKIDEVLSENTVSECVDTGFTNVPKSDNLMFTEPNNSSKTTEKCVFDFTDSSSGSEYEDKCPDSPKPEKCAAKCDNDEMHDFDVLPKSPESGITGIGVPEVSEVKETISQPPDLGEEIANYFNRKHIDNKTSAQVLLFIKHFDFVSEKSHDDALCILKRNDEQLVDLLSFSRCHEVPLTFYSPFNSKKARELVSDCVEQIIRCVTWAMARCSSDKKSVSSDFVPLQVVLQHQHIENFFNQIQDYEISKVYAQSYTFFLNFIVNESKCSLTPHNQDSVERIRLILDEVINCKEIFTVESINSNNLVTQHPEILKRVREHLLIDGQFKDHENLFVLQYLHAFLRLELRKPTWVFKDADFYEYENAVDLEDCKVMVVYNNCKYLKRFQTVIWRREALQLVDRYVCRRKNIRSGNLFRDALYKKFASQIDGDKFINSYYQDDGGKLKSVGHSKEIGLQTVESEIRSPQKKPVRTVGIQCSFQITLEGNNNLPSTDNYTVNLDQGVKGAFVLVPSRSSAESKKAIPTFVDAAVDPIVIPRRHVQAQTSLAIINRFILKEQETQTEDETQAERELPSESEILIESEFQAEFQIKSETENSSVVESRYLNSKNMPKASTIKSVQHALQSWPPTTNGIPLSIEETGFTREIYYTSYYKQFVETQIKLRAKVIVNEIATRRKTLNSDEVKAIAKKHNWPATSLLVHSCLSKTTP